MMRIRLLPPMIACVLTGCFEHKFAAKLYIDHLPIITEIVRLDTLASTSFTIRIRSDNTKDDNLNGVLFDSTLLGSEVNSRSTIMPNALNDIDISLLPNFDYQSSNAIEGHQLITSKLPAVRYHVNLTANGKSIQGDVICNDSALDNGVINSDDEHITCHYGYNELTNVHLKSLSNAILNHGSDTVNINIEINDFKGRAAGIVLESISTCDNTWQICLAEIDALNIEEVWQQLNDSNAVTQFLGTQLEYEW